jgi:hypothetical protein
VGVSVKKEGRRAGWPGHGALRAPQPTCWLATLAYLNGASELTIMQQIGYRSQREFTAANLLQAAAS